MSKKIFPKSKLKKCNSCYRYKKRTLFHKDKNAKDGLCHYCKTCAKKLVAIWRKANIIKHREYSRNWVNKNPEGAKKARERYKKLFRAELRKGMRDTKLFANHGIRQEDYLVMLREQDYRCAICSGTKYKRKGSRCFVVDHNHITDKIRGLLCNKCNSLLGFMGADDIKHAKFMLKQIAKYLNI